MTNLVKAELYKLATTRTLLGLVAGAVALTGLQTVQVIVAAGNTQFFGGFLATNRWIFLAEEVLVFVLVLGVLTITTEFRHGSGDSTFLIEPDRRRVLAAKAAAVFVAGAAFSVVVQLLVVAVARPIILATTDGVSLAMDAGILRFGAAMAVVVGLCGVLGLGFGAAVRNQVGAIVGILAWIIVADQILRAITMTVGRYTVTGAMAAAEGWGEPFLNQAVGFAVLATYVAIATVAGFLVQRRLDLT